METLDVYPGYLIRRMHQLSASHFARILGENDIDLTPVQFAALRTISNNPRLDQVTLAAKIAYDRVTIGGVVDRLVGKKLVKRRQSPVDRRARQLEVTQMGLGVLQTALPLVSEVQKCILGRLSAEEASTLVQLLQKGIGDE